MQLYEGHGLHWVACKMTQAAMPVHVMGVRARVMLLTPIIVGDVRDHPRCAASRGTAAAARPTIRPATRLVAVLLGARGTCSRAGPPAHAGTGHPWGVPWARYHSALGGPFFFFCHEKKLDTVLPASASPSLIMSLFLAGASAAPPPADVPSARKAAGLLGPPSNWSARFSWYSRSLLTSCCNATTSASALRSRRRLSWSVSCFA